MRGKNGKGHCVVSSGELAAPGGASAESWEGMGSVNDDQQGGEVDECGNFVVRCWRQ
jgi:hypothetical protein